MGQLAGKIAQTFGSNAVETHVDGLPDQKTGFQIGPAGLEPATPCLEGRCSIHLSYGRMDVEFNACRISFHHDRRGDRVPQINKGREHFGK